MAVEGEVKGERFGLSRPDPRAEIQGYIEEGKKGKLLLLLQFSSCVEEEAPGQEPEPPLLIPALGPCAVYPLHISRCSHRESLAPFPGHPRPGLMGRPSSRPHLLLPPLTHSAWTPLPSCLPQARATLRGSGPFEGMDGPLQGWPSHPPGPARNSALDSPSPTHYARRLSTSQPPTVTLRTVSFHSLPAPPHLLSIVDCCLIC